MLQPRKGPRDRLLFAVPLRLRVDGWVLIVLGCILGGVAVEIGSSSYPQLRGHMNVGLVLALFLVAAGLFVSLVVYDFTIYLDERIWVLRRGFCFLAFSTTGDQGAFSFLRLKYAIDHQDGGSVEVWTLTLHWRHRRRRKLRLGRWTNQTDARGETERIARKLSLPIVNID